MPPVNPSSKTTSDLYTHAPSNKFLALSCANAPKAEQSDGIWKAVQSCAQAQKGWYHYMPPAEHTIPLSLQ